MKSDSEAIKTRGCCRTKKTNQNNNINSCGSCSKLSVFDYLKDVDLVKGKTPFNVVEVRFKNSRKEFFINEDNLDLSEGDIVAVEASPGHDIAVVSLAGEIVRLQMKAKGEDPNSKEIKKVYRLARKNDIDKWVEAVSREHETMVKSRKIAGELGLDMKINDVEYQGDSTKAIFYYTAEGRVDFRELIKRLAREFRIRIEMKQIGARQESGRLGGIGSCGRELCCSSWLTDFHSVSTIAAKSQQLALNPQKLAGQCGKLKCCLNFEYNNYKEALEEFPSFDIRLKTKKGTAFYQKADIFKKTIWYAYGDEPNHYIPLQIDEAKKIIRMNERKKFPETIEEFSQNTIVEENTVSFDNVVGQDDLTRFDKKKNNNKKPSRNKRRPKKQFKNQNNKDNKNK